MKMMNTFTEPMIDILLDQTAEADTIFKTMNIVDILEIDIILEIDQEVNLEADLPPKSLKKCLIFSKKIMNKYNIVEMKAKVNTINMIAMADIETGIEMIVKITK